jgi:hypothetical protein
LRGLPSPDKERAFKAARQGMPWRFFMLFGLLVDPENTNNRDG